MHYRGFMTKLGILEGISFFCFIFLKGIKIKYDQMKNIPNHGNGLKVCFIRWFHVNAKHPPHTHAHMQLHQQKQFTFFQGKSILLKPIHYSLRSLRFSRSFYLKKCGVTMCPSYRHQTICYQICMFLDNFYFSLPKKIPSLFHDGCFFLLSTQSRM